MKSFRDIFNTHHLEHINKYRYINHNSNCTYTSDNIFTSLMDQTQNKVYFSRTMFTKPIIDGKYLNNIHNKFVREHFYVSLYSKILNEYIKETHGLTLGTLSADSMFVCNVLGNIKGNNKNPQFYNKSGLKNAFISDNLGVPISIIQLGCTDNDNISIDKLLDNVLIDKTILDNNKDKFLMDGGYSSIYNLKCLSDLKFNVYAGYNKRNARKINVNTDIDLTKEVIKIYKKRTVVENLNAIVKRYPILLNNYERTIESYNGLLLFTLSHMLVKKMLNIKRIKDDLKKNKIHEENILKERKRQQDRKNERKIEIENKRKEIETNKNKRETEVKNTKKIITDKIHNLVCNKYSVFYNKYLSKKKKLKEDNKTIKNKKKRDTRYAKMKEQTYINNLNSLLCDKFIDDKILKFFEYDFGEQKRYIQTIEALAFSEENINKLLYEYIEDIDTIVENIIENMTI